MFELSKLDKKTRKRITNWSGIFYLKLWFKVLEFRN